MSTRFFLFVTAIVLTVVLSGCGSKSSSPTAPATNTAPSFPSVAISGPKTTSTDQHAQMTVAYAAEVNAYTSGAVFAEFTGQNGTQSGNTWTWTVTNGTLTVTFSETKQSDGSYTWQWVANGTDPSTHVTYSNWTFFSGTRSVDGKNGDWKVFNDNKTSLAADFSWSTNAGGTLSGNALLYDTTGTLTGKITAVNNTDKSGEVDVYTGTVLTFKATWVAAGSGSWWTYDNTGTQSGTGTWS